MRDRFLSLVTMVAGLALTTAAASAQKGKPALTEIPGDAMLTCSGPASALTDNICGDGSASYVHHALSGGDAGVAVRLREGDRQFGLRFDPLQNPARFLTAFIPERLTRLSHECSETAGNCLSGGAAVGNLAVTIAAGNVDVEDARIQTTMRDSRGNTIEGGPTTLDIGETAPIDVLVGFHDANGYRWALYWSPGVNYPGSTTAQITRTSACGWIIEATDQHIVGLRFFNTGINTGSGKTKGHFEGRYVMPFQLTFTASNCQ